MKMGISFSCLRKAIIDSLSDDLLEPKWRALIDKNDPPEKGHCAIASEALYHMLGGREAGFMPVVCGYDVDPQGGMHYGPASGKQGWRRETHWWVRGPKGGLRGMGDILDVTAGQYPLSFPYRFGRNTGFMQPQQKPSKRAQIVIDRVAQKLGKGVLEALRRENIRRFSLAVQAFSRCKIKSARSAMGKTGTRMGA